MRNFFIAGFITLLFIDCGNALRQTPAKNTDSVTKDSLVADSNQQIIGKAFLLNDNEVLNFFYGNFLFSPPDSLKNKIKSDYHWRKNGSDSFMVHCNSPVFFRQNNDSLCFLAVETCKYSGGDPHYAQNRLLLKYTDERWLFADSTLNSAADDFGELSDIKVFGPYTFLRYKYEINCRNLSDSNGEIFVAIYNGKFLSVMNIKIELLWSQGCKSYNDVPDSRITRTYQMKYDTATGIFQYDFTEKFSDNDPKYNYTDKQQYVAFKDEFFITKNLMRTRGRNSDDTVYCMTQTELNGIVERLKKENK
jgi:hypothetical protein